MGYQSFEFLMFSAIVLIIYYLLGSRCQKWVLLLANIVFYFIAGPEYLPFITITICAAYFAGRWMSAVYTELDEKLKNSAEAAERRLLRTEAKRKAKKGVLLALIVTVTLLVVCKYTGFVITNINAVLRRVGITSIPMFRMILPIGISFYTFMAISYVLDVYWKRYEAERSFVLFAVYLSYFPHVVQGPIDRFNRFKEQIRDGVQLSYKNVTYGAQLVLWGFFKKIVVADRLNIFVSTIYDNWSDYTGILLAIATVLYSIQIYADFSGCIDIVSGVSEMLGIKLDKNFNHPYFARTMPEFWRRWHISLSEWFKDYIYYPVSTSNYVKKVKRKCKEKGNKCQMEIFASCFPALIVWLITGIWHGAAWKFVAWGLFHAALIILGNIFSDYNRRLTKWLRIDTENFGWRFLQMIRTFILCCIGRVFFRAGGLRAAFGIFRNTFSELAIGRILSGNLYTYGLDQANFYFALVSIGMLWIVDMLQEKMCIRDTLAKQNIVFRWIIIYVGLLAVVIFGMYGPGYNASSFIYEQF